MRLFTALRTHLTDAADCRRGRRVSGDVSSAIYAAESLEDRTLLTNYVVDTDTDDVDDQAGVSDGLISLREAIIAAVTNTAFGDAPAGGNDDSITFAAGLANNTISVGPSYEIGNGNLAVDASGLNITLDGGDSDRLFHIDNGDDSTTSITGLILTNGAGGVPPFSGNGGGGAIRIQGSGTTNLSGVTVSNSRSFGDGGGISLEGTATLNLSDSTISGNRTEGSLTDFRQDGGGLYVGTGTTANLTNVDLIGNFTELVGIGGQIANEGRLTMDDSLVQGRDTGFLDSYAAAGLYNGPSALAIISGSQITRTNAANTAAGLLNEQGTVILENTDVTDNLTSGNGGGVVNSGGVLMVVAGSSIMNNTAGDGGGIHNSGRLVINGGVTISGNTANAAVGSGGGIFSRDGVVTIDDSSVTGNSAVRAGGGIEMIEGIVELRDSHVDGNMALGGGEDAPGNGGGLHVTGRQGVVSYVRIYGGTVNNNTAANQGGGLWNNAGNILVVRDGAIVSGNTASGDDVGDGGGGIFNNGGRLSVGEAAQITNNTADGDQGSGGGIYSTESAVSITGFTVIDGNSAIRSGGGIEIVFGLMSVSDSTISNNEALGGEFAPGDGGGIHVSGPSHFPRVDLRNSVIHGNAATGQGGGIWMSAASVVLLRIESVVSGNTASGNAAGDGGGGIYNQGGRLVINNASISNNNADGATGSGGGLLIVAGVTTAENAFIFENTAVDSGGGVEIVNGLFESRNLELSNNDALGGAGAAGHGGGLHVTGTSSVRVNLFDTWVFGNSAAGQGGGLWNESGAIMVVSQGSQVQNNTAGAGAADDGGAGAFNNGGRLAIREALFSGNHATGRGGGVFSVAGGLSIDNSTMAFNNATTDGGGVYSGGNLVMNNSTLGQNLADWDDSGVGTGGGIFNGGTATLQNTLIPGNGRTTTFFASDIAGNNLSFSSRNNLIGDAGSAGGLTHGVGGNIVGNNGTGVLPIFDIVNEIADNGGSTQTYALAPGSVAINAGNNAFAKDASGNPLFNDQRGFGFVRIADGTVDIGAFEVQA